MEIPFLLNKKNLRRFLDGMPGFAVPTVFSKKELLALGFKSSYDEKIPLIMEFIGFVDKARVPTERWKKFRDKENSAKIMAESIKEAYADLFKRYPNANEKDDEALRNVISGVTSADKMIVGKIIDTFKTLCEYADFNGSFVEPSTQIVKDEPTKNIVQKKVEEIPTTKLTGEKLTININLELVLPATTDSQIYDKLFESLKKHLM
jgi:hypothetical protein